MILTICSILSIFGLLEVGRHCVILNTIATTPIKARGLAGYSACALSGNYDFVRMTIDAEGRNKFQAKVIIKWRITAIQ